MRSGDGSSTYSSPAASSLSDLFFFASFFGWFVAFSTDVKTFIEERNFEGMTDSISRVSSVGRPGYIAFTPQSFALDAPDRRQTPEN